MDNGLDVLLNTPPKRGSKIVARVWAERAKIARAREMGHTWAAIAEALGLHDENGKYLSAVWLRIESRIGAKEGVK